jgi:lysophospholipase L1-like esterase
MMLELPLPPFYNSFGTIQRKLTAEFDIPLVPKRMFAGVIFAPDATRDGLHLSDHGHSLMAKMVGDALGLRPLANDP